MNKINAHINECSNEQIIKGQVIAYKTLGVTNTHSVMLDIPKTNTHSVMLGIPKTNTHSVMLDIPKTNTQCNVGYT